MVENKPQIKHIYDERGREVFHSASTSSIVDKENKPLQNVLDSIIDNSAIINVDTDYPSSDGYYTKETARLVIPEERRKLGLIVTFKVTDTDNVFELFVGTDINQWMDPDKWKNVAGNDDEFISAKHDDRAEGNITFEQNINVNKEGRFGEGITVGKFKNNIVTGTGSGITPNLIQADRIEAREGVTDVSATINEIQGMAREFHLLNVGKIQRVVVDPKDPTGSTFKLYIYKNTPGDYHHIQAYDILYSIINTNKLYDTETNGNRLKYTSWFHCINADLTDNSITVKLFGNNEVPGGSNLPPMAGFNITRRGNFISEPRSMTGFISAEENSIMFLQNVVSPLLHDFNYGITIGKMPDLRAFRSIGIDDKLGIYSNIIATQKLYYIDSNGEIVCHKVDRGKWSLEVAKSPLPYRYVYNKKQYEAGEKYVELEQHLVYHNGCKWGCIADKTLEEPRWNSRDWIFLEGDDMFFIEFESSNGFLFRPYAVNTVITVKLYHGSEDITEDLINNNDITINWQRISNDQVDDNKWMSNTVRPTKNQLHLTRKDMGVDWGPQERVTFVCNIAIPEYANPLQRKIITKQIKVN